MNPQSARTWLRLRGRVPHPYAFFAKVGDDGASKPTKMRLVSRFQFKAGDESAELAEC
jgi:hypothetical protein